MMDYVILGRGGASRAVLETLGRDQFRGFYDDRPDPSNPHWLGTLEDWQPEAVAHFIALGAIKNMLKRAALAARLDGVPPLAAISSGVHVSSSANVGAGSILMGVGSLGPHVSIGRHGLFFSGFAVEHDCEIGHNVNVGPGVIISGRVTIGDNVFVGAGTVIRDGTSIGDNCVIGAGSLVLDSVQPNSIAYGHPARRVRNNDLFAGLV